MTAFTPSFLFDLESNMRTISERGYQRLLRNLWAWKVMKYTPSQAKRERVSWFIESAKIERPNASRGGGQAIFEAIVSESMEYENENAVAGLRIKKEQFEDLDGNGINLATHWSGQIGPYAAYWPQKMLAQALLLNPNTYDGQPFFSVEHPINPFDPALGVYANLFTGSASGANPGALPIHEGANDNEDAGEDLQGAIFNIGRAISNIATWRMPNGEDPRMVRVAGIMGPPALELRLTQITKAKQVSSTDFDAVVSRFGLGEPVIAPELGAAFGGSDTTYYLIIEEIVSDELGAFGYSDREPFAVQYHSGMSDAELARMREFQWTTEGRNVVYPGHPYRLVRVEGS